MENRSSEEPQLPWEELFERANNVVLTTIAELPKDLRQYAEKIPFLLEKWPEDEEDGVPDPDPLLGQYLGFEQGRVSDSNGPIVLFLGSIYEYCQENEVTFEEEVRTTYLHEFGHFLGCDEDDLDERGLS